jgi:DNA-binding NarL/FixJ family response regulator
VTSDKQETFVDNQAQEIDRALARAVKMQERWAKIQTQAEAARTNRNGAIYLAHKAGSTQQQIADALGITQAAVSNLLKRGAEPTEAGSVTPAAASK